MRSSKPSPLTSPAPATERRCVACVDAVEAKAVGAVEGREIEAGTEPRGSAEHDVALAGIRIPVSIGAGSADDDIAEAVAVDVPGRGDRAAAIVVRIDAVEAKAVGAVEDREVEAGANPEALPNTT